MARPPILSFDRGTLLLHPPPPGKAWIDYATWDDRVERFRLSYARAQELAPLVKKLLSERGEIVVDARTNTLIVID